MILLKVYLFRLINQVSLNISFLNPSYALHSNKKCNSVSITRMPLLKHKVQYLYSLSIFVWRPFSIIKSWFEHLNLANTLLKTSLTFKYLIEHLLADFSYSRPLDTYL